MHPLLLLTTSSAIVSGSSPRLRTAAVSPVLRTAVPPVLRRTARAPAPVALADDGGGGLLATLESFQSSHALLISILVAIGTRYIISEVRYRFEKPVMDELGNRVATELKPDTNRLGLLQEPSRERLRLPGGDPAFHRRGADLLYRLVPPKSLWPTTPMALARRAGDLQGVSR